ncbi:MAG: FAD-binding oxidoreductase [Cypionkella sp.]|uniref:NAD(P)/FAD-dependent oxidoreductase n=1 Tax=Cypionkella sp. TaxID=2811411 RepID=UPI002ABBCB64|nr:FAD-binding oxidoreductase [Cypionkella sp.]MDZ4310857.1 FAD-binding oxidoreductase [Cypionkella sp.]
MPDHDANTRKDNLRSGTPFWIKTPHSSIKTEPRLSRDRFDVIVVGAGISGALVAEGLTRAGKSVLILDRRPAVRGSTPASTAMIQHEIDVPLTILRKKIGSDHANRAWLRSVRAVADLVDLTADLKLGCQMLRKPALYLAGNALGPRALLKEVKARTDIGIKADYLTRHDLIDRYGMDRPAAILSPASASANPAQLTVGLLEAALARGAHLVSPVEITDMAEFPTGVALATRNGEVLLAEHAVFCTGYEYLPQMKSKAHHVSSTWALASEPLTGLPAWMKATIAWEASDPYLYFRTDEMGRIIAGGEDEDAAETNSDLRKLAAKAKTIAKKLQALTGVKIGKPAYAWSAAFGVTDDGLPMIDRVPGLERVFAVMGFGGNGITFSMIAAQIVTAEILAKPDPDADIFRYR